VILAGNGVTVGVGSGVKVTVGSGVGDGGGVSVGKGVAVSVEVGDASSNEVGVCVASSEIGVVAGELQAKIKNMKTKYIKTKIP
jgi:hypothetical protein